jgi:hypothetical protein
VRGQVFRVGGDKQGHVGPGTVAHQDHPGRVAPPGRDVALDPREGHGNVLGLGRELVLERQAVAGQGAAKPQALQLLPNLADGLAAAGVPAVIIRPYPSVLCEQNTNSLPNGSSIFISVFLP